MRESIMGFRGIAAAMMIAFTLSGCGGIVDPSKNTVTPFSGTFEVGGSDTPKTFSASKNGEFFITLTAVAPDTTAVLAMTFGQQVSGGCAVVNTTLATVGRQAFGGRIDKGNYCVQVGDSGLATLSGPQTYTIRVSVP
jgi:hypothetical protein